MAGINFVDLAYLTKENIIDGRLVYFRRKTNKLIKIPIQNKALELIDEYKSNNLYLFPILSDFLKINIQKANRVHKVLAIINRHLKQIGKELNLPINLTTYVTRHTFSTTITVS